MSAPRYQARPGVFVTREKEKERRVDIESIPPAEIVEFLEKEVREYFTIHRASYFNKLKEVQAHLDKGADINAVDSQSGDTPLILAAKNSNEHVVDLLCVAGVDANAVGAGGLTALHYAARNDSLGIAKRLVEAKADINIEDKAGNSPLMFACRMGHSRMVEYFVGLGCSVNHANKHGVTPSMAAVLNSHMFLVEYLAKKGADLDCQDSEGNTVLHYAASLGYVRLVRDLLGQQADSHVVAPPSPSQLQRRIGSASAHPEPKRRPVNAKLKNKKGQTAADVALTEGIQQILQAAENVLGVPK